MDAHTRESAVTPAESKTIEGQRLTALFGAVAALPAAALVAKGPEGAPLFVMAITCVVAAYMFWMFTDDVYEASITIRPGDPEFPALKRVGYRFQWATFAYGGGSILMTLFGFAGIHSKLRGPLSVEQGFIAVGVAAVLVAAQVGWSMHVRNRLVPLVTAVAARKAAAQQAVAAPTAGQSKPTPPSSPS